MRPVTCGLVCLLGLSAPSLDGRAQPPLSQPQATFQSGIDLVQVDVSVLDKQRRPVRGLTQADFTILEDGKPRPVVAFVPVDVAERESVEGRASWVRDVAPDVVDNDVRPEGRLVVIMFDWSIRFLDQALARRIATAAVDQLGPNDLAAVVFTNAHSNAGTPQNFTADRGRLLAAINRPFALALPNAEVGPTHDPRNANYVMIDDPEGYESGECTCRTCVADTIARVADAVRDVPGRRKTLLFIGTYFRLSEGLQGPVNKARPAAPAAITGVIPMNPNIMACAQPLREAREAMLRATGAANLTIHTIDPVGIETMMNSPLGGSSEGIRVRQDDLSSLADLTGGRAIMHTETPEAQIPALFAESGSYYLIAFAPADVKANGRFHKIEVKVGRPGDTVQTRSGYIAGKPVPPGRAPAFGSPDTIAALQGVLPRADVPLTVTAAPFAMPGKALAAVAVVLGVRQPAPAAGGNGNAQIKVMAAAFDRDGKSAHSEEQTVGVSGHPDASGSSPYEAVSRLSLKPGRYEVRVAVESGSKQRGSVYTYVDVPDFAKVPISLSGIVLAVSPAVPSAGKDAFANLLPVVPTAQRAFARSDRVTAFLQVYQEATAPPRLLNVTARISDTSDRIVLDEPTALPADRFTAMHGADYRLELPLAKLAAGEYLLTIDAAEGKNVARRGLRFTVRQ